MKWLLFLAAPASIGAAVLLIDAELPDRGRAVTSPPASRPSAAADRRREIYASGTVEGARRDVQLQFEIDGRLAALRAAEGDRVQAGDVLAELDATAWQDRLAEAHARLNQALVERERLVNAAREESRRIVRAEVRLAELAVAQAIRDLRRGEALYAKNAVTAQEWENRQHQHEIAQAELELARARAAELEAEAREDDLRIADAQVARARAAVKSARTMLEKTRLVAPCAGTILRLDGEPGQLIGPAQPAPLVTMSDTRRIHVRAFVEELDALDVEVGCPATVVAVGRSERRYAGAVVARAPYMVPKQARHNKPGELIDVKVREVLVSLENAADLVIGLRVDVWIEPPPPDPEGSPSGEWDLETALRDADKPGARSPLRP